jgi:hypothetical protein
MNRPRLSFIAASALIFGALTICGKITKELE